MTAKIRFLHRYIGFFVIGITLVYALSGILLTYRGSDFLRSEVLISKIIEQGVAPSELGKVMHSKISVLSSDGDMIDFKRGEYTGTYNRSTGELVYKSKELPDMLQKMIDLHKMTSDRPSHIFTVTYGFLLLFLAVSSFFMYRPGSGHLKKGIAVSALGVISAIALII